MVYLLEISFDNSCRLSRRRYLFEYKGVRFKLVQEHDPRRWADHLLTVLPDGDMAANEKAFAVACEFVSALGWEHEASVSVWESGGRGWIDSWPVSKAEPGVRTFPRAQYPGNTIGCHLSRLPHVKNEEQRVALALFREATASNSSYLSFLFYWHVLGVAGGDPVGFVNKTYRKPPTGFFIEPHYIERLALGSRSLGNYLLDDCRNAIAHIRRRPGKKALDLDRHVERSRLAISVWVIKAFARHYIRERLGLKEQVHLVRLKPRGFPTFVDTKTLYDVRIWRAYTEPRFDRVFGRSRKRRQ